MSVTPHSLVEPTPDDFTSGVADVQVMLKVNKLANKPGWTAGPEDQVLIYECGELTEEEAKVERRKGGAVVK